MFTFNGTDGLNLALHGALAPGDHVITSVMEHNSVLRPLRELTERIGIEVTCVPADGSGLVDPDAFRIVAVVRDEHALDILGVVNDPGPGLASGRVDTVCVAELVKPAHHEIDRFVGRAEVVRLGHGGRGGRRRFSGVTAHGGTGRTRPASVPAREK